MKKKRITTTYYEFVWQQVRNTVRTDCLNDLLSRGTRRIAVRAFSSDFSFLFPRTVNRAQKREKKFMVVAGSILTRSGNKLTAYALASIPFDTAATDRTLRGASAMIN